jgi:hypothetical protein
VGSNALKVSGGPALVSCRLAAPGTLLGGRK